MAGGTFTQQNRVRPGAYLKFQGVPRANQLTGARGIVTFAAPLTWGPEGQLITITVDDLLNGNLDKLIGAGLYDDGSKLVRAALSESHTLLLYRGDKGGTKAKASLEVAEGTNLEVTAKYAGTAGNKISVEVKEDLDGKYQVITYFGSTAKDSQTVTNVNQLVSNDFVDFTSADVVISQVVVPTLLTNGANGTFTAADYTAYLALLNETNFNTLAAYSFGETSPFNNDTILQFIKNLRETKGIKVQAVVNNYISANYEGIISTNGQGVKFSDGSTLDGDEFVIWVAAVTAGADIFESNTYHIVTDAVEILNDVLEADIESLIKSGYLLISKNRSGNIVIEKDINTLVTMREDTTELFSYNMTIRLLDDIANHIATDFENNYIGKVANDINGQNLFKASVISYLTSLQNAGGIRNFNSSTDVTVEAGEQPDSFYSTVLVQPTYAVEKLYMVVSVQ